MKKSVINLRRKYDLKYHHVNKVKDKGSSTLDSRKFHPMELAREIIGPWKSSLPTERLKN